MKAALTSPFKCALVALSLLTPGCSSVGLRPTAAQLQMKPDDPFVGVPRYETQTNAMPRYLGLPYRSETCRLSFLKPTGWTVVATPNSTGPRGCYFELVRDTVLEASSEETESSSYVPSIYLTVLWQPIRAAVLDAGFHNIAGRWHVEPDPQSASPSRIDLPHGGAGLCHSTPVHSGGRARSLFVCVLGTPSISVRVEFDEDDLVIGEQLIPTIEFLPPAPV